MANFVKVFLRPELCRVITLGMLSVYEHPLVVLQSCDDPCKSVADARPQAWNQVDIWNWAKASRLRTDLTLCLKDMQGRLAAQKLWK